MKKELIYFLSLVLLIGTTNVFFDYQETRVLNWKENLMEAFVLGIIIYKLVNLSKKQTKKEAYKTGE